MTMALTTTPIVTQGTEAVIGKKMILVKTFAERGISGRTFEYDSGQNYESDELDNNSARSSESRNPSSVSAENIPTGNTNRGTF